MNEILIDTKWSKNYSVVSSFYSYQEPNKKNLLSLSKKLAAVQHNAVWLVTVVNETFLPS